MRAGTLAFRSHASFTARNLIKTRTGERRTVIHFLVRAGDRHRGMGHALYSG